MSKSAPKLIKRTDDNSIHAEWQDGFSATISLQKFRDNCPCALCEAKSKEKTEDAIFQFNIINPNQYELKSLKTVGNYAVQAVWGDGHDTGIYVWEYLRKIFEEDLNN
ncbi:MAG: DUF971 domain-containing protein [Bacteroidota bacterium]